MTNSRLPFALLAALALAGAPCAADEILPAARVDASHNLYYPNGRVLGTVNATTGEYTPHIPAQTVQKSMLSTALQSSTFVDLSTAQTIGGAKTATAAWSFQAGASFGGPVAVYDGAKTYPAGIQTQAGSLLLDLGLNDSQFGSGSSNSAPGGFLRFETRAGAFFQWWATPIGGSASSLVMSLDASGRQTVFGGSTIKGPVNIYDGTQTYPAGVLTQANSQLLEIGINNSQFGGGSSNTVPGGFLRFETRGGAFFQWYATPIGGSLAQIMSLDDAGHLMVVGGLNVAGQPGVTKTCTGTVVVTGGAVTSC